ncbi:hypothetical protein [Aliarcobacter cibarius]|jgi:hypothetical protein|uniref:Flagellar protein FlgN n=1 Tax=Aliarcobacter cibarius TaxID=255507 RepID=A0ABY2V429_9BACT|nr:hypothetical protein [Aliarcobacter cibarius]QEZ88553.1 hypothetical protein ACIB15232_0369 [Aliarcobacter cibarius]TLS98947.1 hypothetical protein FE247_06430 [Aliarcobacter cibarius]TLS99863.1 hypothetical protein FE245_06285 [Aliarcobacter cibarius]TLT03770.1 hypothetical protein FE248_06170 [Aliarcobacter cibarius]
MINDIVAKMNLKIDNLKKLINEDISDIKEANHETLLKRNELKQTLIDDIIFCKSELNKELVLEIQKGVDVNIYRAKVDELENNIKSLYELNRKLSAIVLPIQNMYKELVNEFSSVNGGRIFDIKA